MWAPASDQERESFANKYNIVNQPQQQPMLLWYEINGDPNDTPYNTILDGTIFQTLSTEAVAWLNAGTAFVVVHTANECQGPIYTDEVENADYFNSHITMAQAAIAAGFPAQSVIWITGDLNAEATFNHTADIHIISECVFVSMMHRMITPGHNNITETTFDHPGDFHNLRAISPNRHINSHRTYMLSRIFQEGLMQKINLSFPRHLHGKTINDGYCDLRIIAKNQPSFDKYHIIDYQRLAHTCLELYQCQLPRTIDIDPNTNTCLGMDAFLSLKEPYQKSMYCILTESHATGGKCFISEALILSIVLRTPALVVGNKGTIAQMKAWGFHTFDDMFDESYDDQVDDVQRYEMIVQQIREINSWPFAQALAVRRSMQQKMDENFQRLSTLAAELDQTLENKLLTIMGVL
jgi:hypothetical protein